MHETVLIGVEASLRSRCLVLVSGAKCPYVWAKLP